MTTSTKTTAAKDTAPPPPPPGDNYPLCRQVEDMQEKVWWFDCTTAFLTLGVVWGGALLAFTVVDSWGIEGGVPMWARGLLFATLAVWTVCLALWRLYPLCWWQVNPAYAALQLEQAQDAEEPSLKNAVLNWLLLWQERRQSVSLRRDTRANVVWESLGQQAAAAVRSAVPRELERRYHRWLIALVAVCVAMLVYTLVSPKSPFPSVARLLVPIANLLPPQRLYLDVLEPRNAVCFQGEHVTIKVKLSRDPDKTPVHIVYSTNDGRYLQQRVPIGGDDGVTFAREFPPSRAGLESSLAYWIECGDSRSETFQIDVREGVSIDVQSLRVAPPDYTGLEPQTLEGTGNCQSVEGTKILLESRANTPLQWAWWVSGEVSVPATDKQAMQISADQPQRATYQWTLKSSGETVYHLAAEDLDGNKSQRPTRYCVTTIPDEKPTIIWELSEGAAANPDGEIALPLGSTFEATLIAQDPDFALRCVRLHIQRAQPLNTTLLPVRDLLNSPSEGPTNHSGVQRFDVELQSQPLGMKEGEIYEVWGEALDTKLPEANQTESDKLRIRITAPQAEQPTPPQQNNQQQQDNQEQNSKPQDNQQGGEQQSNEQQGDDQQNGEQENGSEQENQQGDEQGGEPGSEQGDSPSDSEGNSENKNSGDNSGKGEEPSEGSTGSEASEGDDESGVSRVDPETQPGDAFDKVLEHLKSERGKPTENDPNRAPDETQQRDDLDPNGQKEPGEPKTGNPKNCPECGSPCESGKCSQCGGQSDGQGGEEGNSQGESQGNSQGSQQGESQSGEQGNSQSESQSGEPQGNSQGESQNGSQGEPQGDPQSESQGENKPGDQAGDTPGQGGGGERGEAENASDESPPPQADDPNLEFTQRQTSLALDYLEKQLAAGEPDPELLKSLGWSRDDLTKFIANWKKIRQAAATGDEKARGDYNELLRSLGIRPAQATSRTRQGHSTANERTTETQSRRIEPPAVLRDRFKNYTERIGQ